MQIAPPRLAYIGGVPSAEADVDYQRAYTPQQAQPAPESAGSTRTQGQGRVWGAQSRWGNAAAQEALAAPQGEAPQPPRLLQHPLLAEIAGADGALSLSDLAAEPDELPAALPSLRLSTASPAEFQSLVWLLYEVTVIPEGGRQRALDLAAGVVREVPVPAGVSPEDLGWAARHTCRKLTGNEQIIDNKLGGVDVVGRTETGDFGETVGEALAARARLRKDYGFDAADRSFEAVERMRDRLEPAQLQPFLDDYLTASFVQGSPPGGGLKYKYEEAEAKPIATFFGNPPGCDQLPDGRGIIDCKGFAAVAELIFRALRPSANERGSTDLALPFCVIWHQMTLLLSGDAACVIDDDEVVPVDASADEVAYLRELHESRFVDGWLWGHTRAPLSGTVDLQKLPSLYNIVGRVCEAQGHYGPPRARWYGALKVL